MKFILRDRDSGVEQDIEAESMSDARQAADDWARSVAWNSELTIWVDTFVIPLDEDGEPIWDDRERVTTTITPTEPCCSERGQAHDWQSPYSILGGLRENPGVFARDAGILITTVCMHCGCSRTINTYAQRPDTGERGFESVTYTPAQYAREVAELRDEDTGED